MARLFEGTLSLDGQPIPARLTLDIDASELATLLVAMVASTARNDDSGSRIVTRPEAVTARPAGSGDTAGRGKAAGFEPIEIRQHPGRRITFEMLEQIDPAKIWAALAERFPWAGFKVPAGGALGPGDLGDTDHPAESGDTISLLRAETQVSQLDSDWAALKPHLDELVDDAGRPVRGYQSRIAEHLGGTNDGHFRRERVMPFVGRLRAWIDEEWLSSSAPDDEEEKEVGNETPLDTAVRVA